MGVGHGKAGDRRVFAVDVAPVFDRRCQLLLVHLVMRCGDFEQVVARSGATCRIVQEGTHFPLGFVLSADQHVRYDGTHRIGVSQVHIALWGCGRLTLWLSNTRGRDMGGLLSQGHCPKACQYNGENAD